MSVSGSVPTSSASISSRFHRVQKMRAAWPATWWLVMRYPSLVMIAPLPTCLHFDFAPLAVFSGDDVNPHQGRFDLRDR